MAYVIIYVEAFNPAITSSLHFQSSSSVKSFQGRDEMNNSPSKDPEVILIFSSPMPSGLVHTHATAVLLERSSQPYHSWGAHKEQRET